MEIPVESGYDIRTVQELLGHRDMKTTIDLPGLIWSRTNVRLDRNREVTFELLWCPVAQRTTEPV